jgi:hypothetical protein
MEKNQYKEHQRSNAVVHQQGPCNWMLQQISF